MVDQDRRRSFALALLPVAAAFRGAHAQDGVNGGTHRSFGRLARRPGSRVVHAGHARTACRPRSSRSVERCAASRCRCKRQAHSAGAVAARPAGLSQGHFLSGPARRAATAIASPAPRSSSTARHYKLTANNGAQHAARRRRRLRQIRVEGAGHRRRQEHLRQARASLARRHQRLSGQSRRHGADQRLREHADAGVRGHHRRADADQPHLASRISRCRAIRPTASTSSGS